MIPFITRGGDVIDRAVGLALLGQSRPLSQHTQAHIRLYSYKHKLLTQRWLDVGPASYTVDQQQINVGSCLHLDKTGQTRGFHSMPFYCWASVKDVVPALKQHWVNASCVLGCCSYTRSVEFVGGFGVAIWHLRLQNHVLSQLNFSFYFKVIVSFCIFCCAYFLLTS